MLLSRFARSSLFVALTVLGSGFASTGQAQELEHDPRMSLEQTQLVESSISKVYRARVLLENYKNWPESYELIRDVLKNDTTLSPVARKKLERANGQIKGYLPGKFMARLFNGRHLLRPFLEASYLINEALMDSRLALNTSSDSEVQFAEQLLKSYFFPGNESRGVIEYPAYETYAFDLFALTAENITAARRESSDDEGQKPIDALASQDTTAAIGDFADLSRANVDLDDRDLNSRFSASNGFIADIVDGGVAIAEITKEVQTLIKRYEVPNRVHNRYLQNAMLLQAIADPGTALFDPQLQAFLKGVRLKVAVGQSERPGFEEIATIKSLLGDNAVTQKDGETTIRLGYLIDQQARNPFMKSGLELSLQDVKGTDRSVIYVISTVAGEEQMMLRTLQMAATIARDADKVVAIGGQVSAAVPVLGKLQSIASLSLTSLLNALPAAAKAVNEMALIANRGAIGAGLKSAAWALKGIVSVQSIGVKISSTLSPRAMKLVQAAKNNKYVKNGTVSGVLTLAVVATQITVGVIEYKATDDEDRKQEIYVDTLSHVGATVSYLLPVVGWGAAALDLGHAFLGVPVETADLFKGYSWAVGATTLWFMGTSNTEIKMDEMEAALILPRNDVFFARWAKQKNATSEETQSSLTKLRAEIQGTAMSEISFIYVSHRSFASKTNNKYGQRLEVHFRSYLNNKKAVEAAEKTLREKLKSQLSTQVSDGGAEGSRDEEGGAEGSREEGGAEASRKEGSEKKSLFRSNRIA